ncbi:hypothetical protein DPMN_125784 [Dreissena polymorpha]|uniref:Uncharacterized protein n=1 Tax=Dreissena polymorpha TaxID=45954 RepID=A0A9D4GV00_DREPO|nr:hypothetical protein DPMN_125784 [Dreissena polymorpha]
MAPQEQKPQADYELVPCRNIAYITRRIIATMITFPTNGPSREPKTRLICNRTQKTADDTSDEHAHEGTDGRPANWHSATMGSQISPPKAWPPRLPTIDNPAALNSYMNIYALDYM